jgi:hypothetical protein
MNIAGNEISSELASTLVKKVSRDRRRAGLVATVGA